MAALFVWCSSWMLNSNLGTCVACRLVVVGPGAYQYVVAWGLSRSGGEEEATRRIVRCWGEPGGLSWTN